MTKKRVSIYTEQLRYVVLLVIVVFSVNIYSIFQDNESNILLKTLFPIAGILISITTYYLSKQFIKNNPSITFDKSTIYIKDTTILFKDVISLKTTSSHINNRHKLKINYLDKNKVENSFLFFPRILHLNFREFTKLIAKHNPKVKIQKQFIGPFNFDKL